MRKLLLFLCLCLPASLFGAGWTASIVEKPERIGFQVRIVVLYTDGQQKEQQEYRFDGGDVNGQLIARVRDALAKLTALDSAVTGVQPGPITIPDPAPNPARDAFVVALQVYSSTKHACELGLMDINGPEMTQASADLKNKFKIEYLDLL